MPYARPTLSQLKTQVANDIAASLKGSDPLLRFAVLRIVGAVLAGMTNEQYGYLDWIAKNAVPFTASGEFLYAWGALKNITLKGAAAAAGSTAFAGCTPGKLIPTGSLMVRGDTVQYFTTADGTVAGDGTVTVPVVAAVAGADGNCIVGIVLTLGVAIAGIQSDSNVSVAVVGGADIETEDEFRDRMLQRYREPPQGGAQSDYVTWALQVPGITRAWAGPLFAGAGTVVVFFMLDDVRAGGGGFPVGTDGVATLEPRAAAATGDQLLLANYLFPLQPVPALVYAYAPTPDPVAFTISGIVDAAVKAAIQVAITDVFRATGSVGGTVNLETGAAGGTVNLLDIEAAIATVPGSEGAVVTVPAANILAPSGHLSTLGAVTWI